ncbi:CDP-glycerol glycerophosphotransferase family protein [Weissella paramesenteroides]|uniref:CDP-glycerol glycerophosphotransferase family protein n=2 Tax=Weissella paramesenteroides TaxID=1249 RepID=UPI003982BE33
MGLKDSLRNGTTLEQRLELKSKLGLNISTEYKFGSKVKKLEEEISNFIDEDLSQQYARYDANFEKEVDKRKSFEYKTKYGTYRKMPIIDNMIMYETFHGNSMTDNPFALFLEIVRQDTEKKYNHVWVLSHDPEEDIQAQRFSEMDNLYFVDLYSDEYLSAIARAKILINNTSFPPYFFRRPNQVYVNTWHGTPLKTLGKDMAGTFGQHKNLARNFIQSTHILSPNKFTGEKIIFSHDLDGVYKGEIIEEGYPRIDLAQKTTKDYLDNVLMNDVQLDKNKKTVLYAPTWRGEVDSVGNINDDLLQKVQLMKSALPADYQVLLKVHPLLYKYIKTDERFENIVISDYLDINEISAFIDVLITDYSSAFIDFLATHKPIILFQYDQEEYLADRGVYIPLDQLSIPIVTSDYELKKILQTVDSLQTNYVEFDKFAYTQLGDSSEKIVNHLLRKQEVKTVNYSNDLKNILVWTGKLNKEKVEQINSLDTSGKNILLWHPAKVSSDEERYVQCIKEDIKVFYNVGEIVYDRDDYVRYMMIRKNTVHQELIFDAERIFKTNIDRMFGDIIFETVIDMDGNNDFWIQQMFYGLPDAYHDLYLSLSDINNFDKINKNVKDIIPELTNVVSPSILIYELNLKNAIKLDSDYISEGYNFSEVNINGQDFTLNVPVNQDETKTFKSEMISSHFVNSDSLYILMLKNNRDKNLTDILDEYFKVVDDDKNDLVIYGNKNQIMQYLYNNDLLRKNILILDNTMDFNMVRYMFINAELIFDLSNFKYDNDFENLTRSISNKTRIIKYDSLNVINKCGGFKNSIGFTSVKEGIFAIKEFKHYKSLLEKMGADYARVLDEEFGIKKTNNDSKNYMTDINDLILSH